jgi:hypothetical protein
MGLSGKRVLVKPEVLVRELRGEAVLLDLASESYFGLDDVGTGMWRALTAAPTIEGALDSLLDEYDVTRERLAQDLEAFVEKLSNAGLVEVQDA